MDTNGDKNSDRPPHTMRVPSFLKEHPTKIVDVELNYRDHAEKIGMKLPAKPLFCYKPIDTIIGPDDEIVIPRNCFSVDYQATLAIIIKSKMHGILQEEVMKHVEGYTCANDLTAREEPAIRGQYYLMKSYPTLTPLGPAVVKNSNPNALTIECYVNGKRCQKSNTNQFLFSVEELLAAINKDTVLYPGDIVLTGTPYGIGPVFDGDVVEVVIESIGRLRNHVVKK